MIKFANWGNFGKEGFILCLISVGAIVHSWNIDNDGWFILNHGRYIIENGFPHTEPFTVHENLHFIMEQWATAVIFWKSYVLFGTFGPLYVVLVVGIAIILLYHKIALTVSGNNRHISGFLTFAVFFVTGVMYFVTRPQIISTLILLSEIFFVEKYVASKNKKYLAALPVLSILMINFHAAVWIMLFVLLLPYLAAWLFRKLKISFEHFPAREFDGLPIFFAAVAMFACGFLNPYGSESMTFVIKSYDVNMHLLIAEMLPPTLYIFTGKVFFPIMFFTIVVYSRNKLPLEYFLITFGLMFMTFLASRNLFLFTAIGTFPFAYVLKDWKSKIFSDSRSKEAKIRLAMLFVLAAAIVAKVFISPTEVLPTGIKIFFAVMGFFLLCHLFFFRIKNRLFDFNILELRVKYEAVTVFVIMLSFFTLFYPKAHDKKFGETFQPAIDFLLEKNNPEGIVLWTGYTVGSYAEFRGIRCYIDPRMEVFLPENTQIDRNIMQEYIDLRNGGIYYKDFFRKNKFTHILVTPADNFVYKMLPQDENFKMIYEEKNEQGKVVCRIFEPVD